MARFLSGTLSVLGLPLALVSGSVQAQYYDDPGLGQKPVNIYPQDYKPLGIRAGSFMLHPGVQLAVEYTDNVFFTENDTKSDVVYHIRPYITAQSTWSRHSLNVRLAADIGRYGDYGQQDYEDYFFDISGKVDVKNRSYMSYGLNYMDLHEDRSTRDAEQGFEPTRYKLYGGNIGYDHSFNRLSLGASYTHQWLDYNDSISDSGEIINNQDRDHDEGSLFFRAGYQFKTDMQAFATYAPYKVKYDQELDSDGRDRSGDGYTATGGLTFTVTGKLNGDVSAAYHDRSYDDPNLPEVDGWAMGAGLQWNPTYLTSIYGRIDSSIEETTSQYSSGYLRTLYSMRVDHELRRNLQLNAFVSYSDNDYTLVPDAPPEARSYDKVWRSGVGASWFINRFMYLNASYDWEQVKTDAPDDDYTVNRVWLVLGMEY
ncbi:MAG TPA: outer membrane beta-barrel protein [Xanthomonadales bacterium]|nr:outer membrane beta-barrel protein [Xanthomonadales bacterium]